MPISQSGSFRELNEQVAHAGLLRARPGYFTFKIIFNLVWLVATWEAVLLLGDSWWQLAAAVALAIGFVQTGFIAHDSGHKQISTVRGKSQFIGRIHMNLLLGVAYGWWINHHNRHHSDPNNLDKDPDTIRRQVIFAVDEMEAKAGTPFKRFVIRFQSVMFFVLLGQEAVRLRRSGVQAARAGRLPTPLLELGLCVLHLAAYVTIVFWAMPPLKAVLFILIHQILFGLYLGGVFAPNHKGMVVYRNDTELDWLHRQVLTSRNIKSSLLTDFAFGGLNYQIEHHLFPSMPRVALRKARPIVLAYCREHGLPYREVPMWHSYREVSRFLGRISRQARA
ncbi:fatty acid desaturase family protein [Actinocorallia lasiicapitis]